MLLVAGSLALAVAAFLVAEAVTFPARRRRELLKRVATYGSQAGAAVVAAPSAPVPAGVPGRAVSAFAGLAGRLAPRTTRESIARKLLAAGVASLSAEQLLAAKGLLAALGILLGIVIAAKLALAAGILLGCCLTALGFLLPDLFVNGRIRARREWIEAALPDALDLLAVSVEAGLGFEGAVMKLVEYMEGPLIDEFGFTLNEIRLGESRVDALKRLDSRIDLPQVSTFIGAVVQAEQLGTSMASILRAQAADARVNRQLSAEEKAMKLPIKMLVPTAVFILPALFIIVLGAALMNLGKPL